MVVTKRGRRAIPRNANQPSQAGSRERACTMSTPSAANSRRSAGTCRKVHGDLPPGRGVVNFIPYLQAIKDLDFDGTISIELEYSPEPAKIVEWVQEAYRETDKLLRQMGLRG